VLIPFGLVWILFTGAVVVLPDRYGKKAFLIGAAVVIGLLLIVTSVWPAGGSKKQAAAAGASKEAA
jgi:hypothetical protein